MPPFLFLAMIALGGLVFILLIGRRRRTSHGTVETPAPASPDSPLFAEPDKSGRKS
jgi:hypothetical protein